MYKDETPVNQFIIQGGGGGGGGATTSAFTFVRVTPTLYTLTGNQDVTIKFKYACIDNEHDVVDSNYSWKLDGRVIKTGSMVSGIYDDSSSEVVPVENAFTFEKDLFYTGSHTMQITITDANGNFITNNGRYK